MAKSGPLILILLVVSSSGIADYFVQRMLVSAESTAFEWTNNSDLTPVMTSDNSYQIKVTLMPNATTVYTNALRFTSFSNSVSNLVKLELSSINDPNGIISGLSFYICKGGSANTSIPFADSGSMIVEDTNGKSPICAIEYYQNGAKSNDRSTVLPVDSLSFHTDYLASYVIAIEGRANPSALSTQTGSVKLELVWSQ